MYNVTADPSESTNLLGAAHVTPAHKATAARIAQRLQQAGAAAPPVSRFFEEGDPEQPGGGGGKGGYFGKVLDDICAQGKQAGFLEPTQ